jgi:putative oxidoreductase
MTPKNMDKMAWHVGRVLLGLYFVLPGIAKFVDWQTHIELMQRHNVPFADPLLVLAGIANFILGGMLLANRHLRAAAYGCALYILVINFSLHDFWNFSGTEGAHETQNFVKNLGIMAGCLMLAGLADRLKNKA